MAKLYVVTNFQYKGGVIRCGDKPEDATINVTKDELKAAKDEGKHPKTGRWFSPLMNHCIPADDEARKIMGIDVPDEQQDEEIDEEAEIEKLRAEFDKIGKAYDPRWKMKRLNNELTKAKKEVGA